MKKAASILPDELRALERLWPNRVHESNWLKAAFCGAGFHRWHELELPESSGSRRYRFCRWCIEVIRN